MGPESELSCTEMDAGDKTPEAKALSDHLPNPCPCEKTYGPVLLLFQDQTTSATSFRNCPCRLHLFFPSFSILLSLILYLRSKISTAKSHVSKLERLPANKPFERKWGGREEGAREDCCRKTWHLRRQWGKSDHCVHPLR